MKRAGLWCLAVALSMALTLLIFFPASWVAALLERQTSGRLILGDAQGTLWRGSAFVGGAASGNSAVTPLLPGRFSWRLSPLVFCGVVDISLDNPAALAQTVTLHGSWSEWQVSPSALLLPAAGLAGLGAPLNTIAPSGILRLTWSALTLGLEQRTIALNGKTTLEMRDMASRLSPIRPLGSYALSFDWHGQQAQLVLSSLAGPLLLDGRGSLNRGHVQFSGRAQAATGYEETLANLLNLLGRRTSDKNIIALEFRS